MTDSNMHTADEFIQEVQVDHCVKIVENAHWLHEDMSVKPDLVQLLVLYPPGTILKDKRGKYWRRRAKAAVTCLTSWLQLGKLKRASMSRSTSSTYP